MIDATKAATPFDYAAIEEADGVDAQKNGDALKEHDLELLRRVGVFVRDRIIARGRDGKCPDARTIAVRLVVLQELLAPAPQHTLASIAREFGCTRSYASKVATAFSDSLGMRASWQRIAAREVYRERAKAVHAGTWTATDKWERRKLREAKARKAKADTLRRAKKKTNHGAASRRGRPARE